jgi:hypothetical protein
LARFVPWRRRRRETLGEEVTPMLHPDTRLVWVDDHIGHGVVVTRPIPRGTILWALDPLDHLLSRRRVEELGPAFWPVLERYSYINASGSRILCWDFARYMNHHCEAVSHSPGTNFEIAVRDLEAGEAVTCDYSSLNLEEDLECACRSPQCRRLIRAADAGRLAAGWDALLQAAIQDTPHVPQPLLDFVEERQLLRHWAAHPESLPSTRLHLKRPDAVHRAARARARSAGVGS